MSNRDIAATWRYHDGTKHSPLSVRQNRHFLDWEIMPRPFKIYPGLEPIALPRDFDISARPALEAIRDSGAPAGGAAQLDRRSLARLLHCSAGVLRRRKYPGGEVFFRAAACTGALYHIDVYVICGQLSDLEAGVYHFGPHDFALRQLRVGDYRGALAHATGGYAAISEAPVVLACTSTFWRNAWKYQARAYRHCFWDSGTLLANLLAAGAAVNLPMQIVLGFADNEVDQLLDLDTSREVALSLVPVGRGAPEPPVAPPAPPLGLETEPLSAREVDYPAIREMHTASSLASPQEAAEWRRHAISRPETAPAGSVVSLPAPSPADEPTDPVEHVIARRGSTRVFSPQAIGTSAFCTILKSATKGVPGDFTGPATALTDVYVIVNAVDGLDSGAYAYQRQSGALDLLHRGDFRRQAGHLDLGQELAADAAVNLYWLSDLSRVLERFGNRGYRAAQLEAAIEAGKAYLGAFALGIGATGLTFFDDEVTQFFSPHAAAKSVLFLIALGRQARGEKG